MDFSLALIAVTTLLVLLRSVVGKSFYCQEGGAVQVITSQNGTIRTLFEGQGTYSNNMHCAWRLEAGEGEGRRIQVTIKSVDLQWAPENAICYGYDFINIYDGPDEKSPELVSFCGTRNPRSITTTGRAMYITFTTSDRNADFSGASLQFDMFSSAEGVAQCPPGWHASPDAHCYQVKQHEETWSTAQQFCHYDQSNLVSLRDDQELSFVNDLLRKHLKDNDSAWIGLNDIEENGNYRWIDGVTSSVKYRWRKPPHTPNRYWQCVAVSKVDLLWQESFCTESQVQTLTKFKFVCKKNKVGLTNLFPLPDPGSEDAEKQPPESSVLWVVLGSLAALVVLGALIATALICSRRPGRKPEVVVATPREELPLEPSRPRPEGRGQEEGDRHPPSYEEAIAVNK